MGELTGRVALVTGAQRGIGRSIAVKLAGMGAKVAVNDLPGSTLASQVVADINSSGAEAVLALGDVSKAEDVKAIIRGVTGEWGKLDILVNNAAIFQGNFVLRMKDEDWDDVMDVDLRSVYLCTKYALRGMVGQGWGRVINIASVAGIMGDPSRSNYSAAKAGIIGFTKAVAREVGSQSITVNAIAPGLIMTEMGQMITDKEKNDITSRLSIKRFGTPEDVAGLVAFLAGDGGSYITAQVIQIDGGVL